MRPPRLLCLPGKGDTAANFERMLRPLRGLADLVCVDAPHPLGNGFAWWELPPGERSFTTPTFEGWDETVAHVRQEWADRGPFDGFLGFSQGAILIASLVATGALAPAAQGEEEEAVEAGADVQLRASSLVLVGSAVPGPYRDRVAALAEEGGTFRALHVIGERDAINPPAGAYVVAKALGGELLEHPGGHELPVNDEALAAYRAFFEAS